MQKFEQCPNCRSKGSSFTHRNIYECDKCEKVYCDKCGSERCPNCGSKDRTKVGEAH